MAWSKLNFEQLETHLLFFCRDLRSIEPTYSSAILKEICGRYNRDRHSMNNDPDPYKQAAVAIFWIKKLRPIYVVGDQPIFLNEAFAYYFGIGPILHNKISGTEIPKQYRPLIKEMFYALRYQNITPQTLDFLLKALYPRMLGS